MPRSFERVSAELKADGRIIEECCGIQLPDEDSNAGKSKYGPDQGYSGRYRDDLTGQVLRDDLVRQARKKELEYFAYKNVWVKVPYQRAYDCTGKPPISVRWIDTKKGDEEEPNNRSRYVARQLKALDASAATCFAPSPPLEALRTTLSLAMI